MFLIEFCTVLCNEYFDLPSDKINKNYSMFTGGSRMIVIGNIKSEQVKSYFSYFFNYSCFR